MNPSEELDSRGIIRLMPLDPTHPLQSPTAHVTAAVVLLSGAGSKLKLGKMLPSRADDTGAGRRVSVKTDTCSVPVIVPTALTLCQRLLDASTHVHIPLKDLDIMGYACLIVNLS